MSDLQITRKANRGRLAKAGVQIKKDLPAWLLFLPCLFLLYTIIWNPMVRGIILSFFELKGYTPVQFAGLANFKRILSDTHFLQTLINTVQYVLWSLVIGFAPPVITAILLNEVVHCKGFFKFSIYFPVMVPSVAAALIWTFLYQPGEGGVLNMLLSYLHIPPSQWLENSALTIPLIVLFMTWKTFGSTTILFLANLQGINQDLYEASTIDGASAWTKLRVVTLPHLRGMLLLMFVRQIIGLFQVMTEPLTMTGGGPNNASMSLALQGYYYGFVYFQAGNALALGVVTFVLLMIVTAFYFKVERHTSDI